jgi:hypothetical protein
VKKHKNPLTQEAKMKTQRNNIRLGQAVITRNAMESLHPEDVLGAMRRHAAGDWGDCCPEDWEANNQALRDRSRLFSVYHDRTGTKFWIITEADRSATTILLPEDY